MRIGCLQFAPQVGDVDNNLNRADAVLNRADPDYLDLLVLPELAFSGYNFKALSDVTPFLEHSGSGISSLWARTVALKYDCTVIVGYPEKVDPVPKWPTGPEYYNAAIVVNGDGETVANYRKTHLFMTDEKWALENPSGFYKGFLVGLGRTAIGICMDLKFEAPWHAFEFAFHVLDMDANLVVLSMAWMTRQDGRMFSRMPQEPDMDTLAYWVTRLEPIIRSDNEDEIIFVFANRTGSEDDAVYAGTSAVLGIKDGEVRVYGILGRGDKELLLVDTDNPPFAKLIHQPDGNVVPANGAASLHRSPIEPRTKHATFTNNNDNHSDISEGGHTTGSGSMSGHASSKGSSRRSPKKGATTSSKKSASSSSKKGASTTSSRRQGHKLSLQTDAQTLRSFKEDSPTVQTPTCPSPTPVSMRPRLMIPPPASLTMNYPDSQFPTPHPMVLHSAQEEIMTAKYLKSQYPTPHPMFAGQNFPIQIFGGHVSFSPGATTPGISPSHKSMSHFSDESPVSPQLYWIPSLESPDGLRNQAPAAKSDGTAFSEAESNQHNGNSNPALSSHQRPASQPQTVISRRRPTPAGSATGTSHVVGGSMVDQKKSTGGEHLPDRPASPKSRNASRSRGPERPGSAIEPTADLEMISQKLGEIAKRVSSVQGRGTPVQARGIGQHPGGAKDQELVEELREQRVSNASRHSTIPIAACISLWENEQVPANKPAVQDTAAQSIPVNGNRNQSEAQQSPRSMSTSTRGRDVERPPSRSSTWQQTPDARTVSRGRQPKANHSTPSRPTDQTGRGSARRSRPSASAEPVDLSQFRLIEEYRSADCPLHGTRPQSATQSHESPRRQRRASNGPPRRIIAHSPPQQSPPPHRAQTSAPILSSVQSVLQPIAGLATARQNHVPDFSMSVESLNSSNPSPKTPFEPQTPKAMTLVFDLQSAPITEMGLKCVEKEMIIPRPKSAVW